MSGTGSGLAEAPVTIVLCTWNGSRYIDEQLQSLLAQDWPVQIRIHDDASTDDTLSRLQQYANDPRVHLHAHTDNVGHTANFARGIAQALEDGALYIALSDQDDRWHPSRIRRGMQAMQLRENEHGRNAPVLVHSDLRVIDAQGRERQSSYLKYRGFSISDARDLPVILGQNGVMGNTILLNRALAELAAPFPATLHVHDYWLALLAELYGYRALITEALVDYRIHSANSSNAAHRLRPLQSWSSTVSLGRRFLARDLQLPFLEDRRELPLRALLGGDGHRPPLSDEQRRDVQAFLDYLELRHSRRALLRAMLHGRYLRKGWLYRCRFAWNLLLTRRYSARAG